MEKMERMETGEREAEDREEGEERKDREEREERLERSEGREWRVSSGVRQTQLLTVDRLLQRGVVGSYSSSYRRHKQTYLS
jgi:hypothetical protein